MGAAGYLKQCSKCGEMKRPSDFGADKTCRDGLRSRCKECRAQANAEWRERAGERFARQQAEYRRRNFERLAAVQANRRAADQETVLRHSADRRARKRAAFVETVRRSDVWERDQGICGICERAADPNDWHLDHVIPLARGGTHEMSNVQVSHPACNQSKGAKAPQTRGLGARKETGRDG